MTASQMRTVTILIAVVFVFALIALILYFSHEKKENEYERILAGL